MNRRKLVVGKTAQYLRDREAKGLPLPPTMRRGSPEYVKSSYWTTLNQRCVNGAHFSDTRRNASYKRKNLRLEISKEEFFAWVDENWSAFASLYADGKTPSIDRKDNSIGYTYGNMQVIDLKENMRKDRIKQVKRVDVFTGFQKIYPSARDAEIDGFDRKGISAACIGGWNHKGNSWSFV